MEGNTKRNITQNRRKQEMEENRKWKLTEREPTFC